MDEKRKRRYNQKINELEDRLEFIEENLPGNEEGFTENWMLRKAIYKEFQEAVKMMSDIAAMIRKDAGGIVEDDYSNIERACNILRIDGEICRLLKRANGLRNVIVHEYNGVDDSLAYESMKECLPALKRFMESVIEWLKKS